MRLTKENRVVWWVVMLSVWIFCSTMVVQHTLASRDYLALVGKMGLRGAKEADTPLRSMWPSFAADAETWVRLSLDVSEGGESRERFTHIDNAPEGREVYWNSGWAWLMSRGGMVWQAVDFWQQQRVYSLATPAEKLKLPVPTPLPLPIATERAAFWQNLPVFIGLIILFSAWVGRRAGAGAGALIALAMLGHGAFYEGFSPAYPDHHGLLAATAFGVVLGAIFMGAGWWQSPGERPGLLPESARAARGAAVFSAVSGALGMWISAASVIPPIAIVGLTGLVVALLQGRALLAQGAKFDAGLWRLWGRVGAAASFLFYLLEFAPSHFGMRLEANHPLHALAWLGGSELIAQVIERWLAPTPAKWKPLPLTAWKKWGRYLGIASLVALSCLLLQVKWTGVESGSTRTVISYLVIGLLACFLLIQIVLLLCAAGSRFWAAWPRLIWPVLAVLVAPICIKLGGPAVFVVSDPFLANLHKHIAEFLHVWQRIQLGGWGVVIAIGPLHLVPLLLAAGLGPRRLLHQIWGAIIVLSVSLFLVAWIQGWKPTVPATKFAEMLTQQTGWPQAALVGGGLVLFGVFLVWEGLRWRTEWFLVLYAVGLTLAFISMATWEMRWLLNASGPQICVLFVVLLALIHDSRRVFHLSLLGILTAGIFYFIKTDHLTGAWSDWLLLVSPGLFAPLVILTTLRGRPYWQLAVSLGLAGLSFGLAARFQIVTHPDRLLIIWLIALLTPLVLAGLGLLLRRWTTLWSWLAIVCIAGIFYLPTTYERVVGTQNEVAAKQVNKDDALQPFFRDVARALRATQPTGTITVLSSPNSSTGIGYYGRFQTLGTLYWENNEGLKAAAAIFSAESDDDARLLLAKHGVTHIAMITQENFLQEYFELSHPDVSSELVKKTFGYRLLIEKRIPVWLETIPYKMPDDLATLGGTQLLFKVNFQQTPAEAIYHIGLAQATLGQLDQARQSFLQVTKLDPQMADGWLRLSENYLQKSEWDAAADALVNGINRTPADGRPSLYNSAGINFYQRGATAQAIRLYRLGLQLPVFYPVTANNLAWLLSTSKDIALRNGPEALALAQRIVAIDPNAPSFLDVLGAALAENGRYDEAVAAGERALAAAQAAGLTAMVSQVQLHILSYRANQAWRQ